MNDTKNRKYIGLYLPRPAYDRLMELLNKIPYDQRPSRSYWIAEAVEEKLKREDHNNN